MKAAILVLATPLIATEVSNPESLIDGGHWKRLRVEIEPRYRAALGDAEANYLMSRVKFAFGDTAGAIPPAEKAVALIPGNADYHFHLANPYGRQAQNAGIFKGLGLARKFRKEAEAALAINPRHPEAQIAMMHYYYEAPRVIGGDKQKARAIAEQMARTDPVFGNIAKARLAGLEKDQASSIEGYYRRALEANPRRYESQTTLANHYVNSGKHDLAEQHAREALKLDPGRSPAYTILAAAYASRNRFAEMENVLAQAERQVPDNLYAYYNAGNLLLSKGQSLDKAEAYFRKYLSQEPEGGAPPQGYARWRLGLVLEKMNRTAEAVSEVESAVKAMPDFEPARKDLRRLKR